MWERTRPRLCGLSRRYPNYQGAPRGRYPAVFEMIWTLQYLRALAAVLVVVAHSVPDASSGLVHRGNFGVDIFFVISGFIMWSISGPKGREHTPWEFAKRRIARIVPLYWLATGLTIICLYAAPAVAYVAAWPRLSDILLSATFIPHPDAHGRIIPVLSQGWTIDLEMAFYAVMTLALCARWRLPVIAVGLAVIAALWNPVALEFGAGVVIAASGWRPGRTASFIFIFAAMVTVGADLSLPRVLAWGPAAAALVLGALGLEDSAPRWQIARRLGDASFTLYLFHEFVTTPVKEHLPLALAPVVSVVGSGCLALALHPIERWTRNAALRLLSGRGPITEPTAATPTPLATEKPL